MLDNPEKSMHNHLATSPNRYTERVLEYTYNGNVRRFQHHIIRRLHRLIPTKMPSPPRIAQLLV